MPKGEVGAQNLIRLAQLTVLPLQRLETKKLVTGRQRALSVITLCAPHPFAQGLRRAADLRGNRLERRPLRRMILLMIQNQANGALANLR